jgi:beta-lactamase class A
MRKKRTNSELMKKYFPIIINLLILTLLIPNQVYSQDTLQKHFEQIADTINGNIGISALHLESGESISFNGDVKFPMQSVYKFPIAMVMLHEIDNDKFSLGDTIEIKKAEFIPEAGHSPIRDKYPNGANLTIKEILEYNVSQSDGTACDVLLRLLGGTEKVQKSIHAIGVKNIAISTTEMVQVANDTIQYQNWSTPIAMNELLEIFYKGDYLSKESQDLLLVYMSISNKWFDRRIKGLLPEETELAHKTGTARTYNGLTRATNDAGIITLPDGSHLAITVFISDSYDSQTKREMTIARASKEAYDYWTEKK